MCKCKSNRAVKWSLTESDGVCVCVRAVLLFLHQGVLHVDAELLLDELFCFVLSLSLLLHRFELILLLFVLFVNLVLLLLVHLLESRVIATVMNELLILVSDRTQTNNRQEMSSLVPRFARKSLILFGDVTEAHVHT